MKQKDQSGDYLSTYVRKINVSGSEFCIYGNTYLVMQARKIYLSMLQSQQNTCLVRRTTYPPHSYHFIEGSLQTIHQVRLGPVTPWHMCV